MAQPFESLRAWPTLHLHHLLSHMHDHFHRHKKYRKRNMKMKMTSKKEKDLFHLHTHAEIVEGGHSCSSLGRFFRDLCSNDACFSGRRSVGSLYEPRSGEGGAGGIDSVPQRL